MIILENLFADVEYDKFMYQHNYDCWLQIGYNTIYIPRHEQTYLHRISANHAYARYVVGLLKERLRAKWNRLSKAHLGSVES